MRGPVPCHMYTPGVLIRGSKPRLGVWGPGAAIGRPGPGREVRGALFCRGQRLWVQGTGILATGACQSLVMQRPGAPAWVWGAEVCERRVTPVCAWGAKGPPGPRGAPVRLFLKLRWDGERGLPHSSL